jgi:hypothetical protein
MYLLCCRLGSSKTPRHARRTADGERNDNASSCPPNSQFQGSFRQSHCSSCLNTATRTRTMTTTTPISSTNEDLVESTVHSAHCTGSGRSIWDSVLLMHSMSLGYCQRFLHPPAVVPSRAAAGSPQFACSPARHLPLFRVPSKRTFPRTRTIINWSELTPGSSIRCPIPHEQDLSSVRSPTHNLTSRSIHLD